MLNGIHRINKARKKGKYVGWSNLYSLGKTKGEKISARAPNFPPLHCRISTNAAGNESKLPDQLKS